MNKIDAKIFKNPNMAVKMYNIRKIFKTKIDTRGSVFHEIALSDLKIHQENELQLLYVFSF